MKNFVKEARREAGLSQEELAKLIGISRSQLSLVENGHSNPTLIAALRMAEIFKRSTDDLFKLEKKDRL